MPGQRQRQIGLGNAAAVIADADQLAAAFFQLDVDARRPGIQAVFHQLLDHGGGALHHLSGSDLVGQQRR